MTSVKSLKRCSVGLLLEELKPDDRAALAGALSDSDWSTRSVRSILAEENYTLSDWSVKTHRRGECTSERCLHPTEGVRES